MGSENFEDKLDDFHKGLISEDIYSFPKVNKPHKVVVPKEVAEWLKECKRSGWHLQKVLSRLDDDEKVGDWAYDENDDLIPEKADMIARAWLDGYEIEQEKLYTVEIPDPHGMYKIRYLFRNGMGSMGNICIGGSDYRDIFLDAKTHLTESEIKQDFEWAWDAGFAKPTENSHGLGKTGGNREVSGCD